MKKLLEQKFSKIVELPGLSHVHGHSSKLLLRTYTLLTARHQHEISDLFFVEQKGTEIVEPTAILSVTRVTPQALHHSAQGDGMLIKVLYETLNNQILDSSELYSFVFKQTTRPYPTTGVPMLDRLIDRLRQQEEQVTKPRPRPNLIPADLALEYRKSLQDR